MRGVTALLGPLKYLLLAAALAYPLTPISDVYVLHVVVLVMVYMVLAMGLNILPGFCGLLDLGYVGFYGIGAYTAGLLTLNYDLSFWVIVPLAVMNGALWGVILGAPTLRLVGDYFAIVTFGFAELVVLFLTTRSGSPAAPWAFRHRPVVRGPLLAVAPPESRMELEVRLFRGDSLLLPGHGHGLRRLRGHAPGGGFPAGPGLAGHSRGSHGRGLHGREPVRLQGHRLCRGPRASGPWPGPFSPDGPCFCLRTCSSSGNPSVLCMVVLGGLGNINGALIGSAVLISWARSLRCALPGSAFRPRPAFWCTD